MSKNRQYPIIMGLGTKIVTAYHMPTLQTGLTVGILDSDVQHEVGKHLMDEELKDSNPHVRCEIYFDKVDTLDCFIELLQQFSDDWNNKKI